MTEAHVLRAFVCRYLFIGQKTEWEKWATVSEKNGNNEAALGCSDGSFRVLQVL